MAPLFLLFVASLGIHVSSAVADTDHGDAVGDAPASPAYYVGDGDSFDFAIEVLDDKKAILYLTKKPSNEPVTGAILTLQSGHGGDDIKFSAGKEDPGTYMAILSSASSLPGQVTIQTESDSDAIETTVPKYKNFLKETDRAILAKSNKGDLQSHSSGDVYTSFAAGFGFALLGAMAFALLRKRRSSKVTLFLAALITASHLVKSEAALAHGGHDHGGPSMETGGDAGGDVVMFKKSQILLELRTVPAKLEAVPGVMKTYGHIIPKPQLDATITAPQSGFLRSTQGLSLGQKVRKGQLLASLQSVSQIRLESPIDGEITEIYTVDGARVEVGSKIIRVTNPSTLWVDAEMFSSQLVELPHVIGVTVAVEGVSEPIKGRLVNAITSVSEETRTAKVFLELVSPSPSLRIGMLANVYFALDRSAESIPLPASAILNKAGDRIVFIQTGPETFTAREVMIEDSPVAGTVLVTQGVKDGERVVVSGSYQLLMKAK
jgi:multidrug efflux pump subunit AcrA (membrane-fusion protein)